MAGPYYVRSTDGSDADSGLTWALAKATLAGALAVAVAGERIWVSQAHAETQASSLTLTCAGTAAALMEILCGNDAAEPPTSLATTATITTTGNSNISIAGSLVGYGITFICGTGATNNLITLTSGFGQDQYYDTCAFTLVATGPTATILMGANNADPKYVRWIGCTAKFADVGQGINLGRSTRFEWIGGSVDGAGSIPTSLFRTLPPTHEGAARLHGVDLSALGSSKSLVNVGAVDGSCVIGFEQCKLGASVALVTGTDLGPGATILMDNSDSADTQYRMQRHSYEGNVYSETTIVRTAGASDGTTPLSHKMVSSAGRGFYTPLYGPELVIWNNTTGSSKTATVEIVHDSVTALTDGEVWLEVEHLGTSGAPVSSVATDRKASLLATAAAQTNSSVAWTTTGITNVNKQKLAVTFTPQEIGLVRGRVALAKSSYTVYVDPLLTVA